MQWTHPKNGSQRQRRIFAFLPRRCADGKTHWLCFLEIREQYYTYGTNGWWSEKSAIKM